MEKLGVLSLNIFTTNVTNGTCRFLENTPQIITPMRPQSIRAAVQHGTKTARRLRAGLLLPGGDRDKVTDGNRHRSRLPAVMDDRPSHRAGMTDDGPSEGIAVSDGAPL